MILCNDYREKCSYHITHIPVCPTWTNRGVNNSINFFPPEQIASTDCSDRCALVWGQIKDIFLLGGWWMALAVIVLVASVGGCCWRRVIVGDCG